MKKHFFEPELKLWTKEIIYLEREGSTNIECILHQFPIPSIHHEEVVPQNQTTTMYLGSAPPPFHFSS
jgi:hypothetical protein